MTDLLLNQNSRLLAEAFVHRPSHALLISGPVGSGKATIARMIASKLLGLGTAEQLENYPYFTYLKRPDDKQDISIDSIRHLNKLLKLKAPGSREIRRLILIEDAHYLNDEAANALLKMLEEPAADCVFILTATSLNNLLPTITSRTQQLQIGPVSLVQSLNFLAGEYQKPAVESAWSLSGGQVGLMLAILDDDKGHPLKIAIDEAKDYLRSNGYQRALLIDSLSRDKIHLALVLEAMLKLLGAVQHSGLKSNSVTQQKKLLDSRKLVLKLQNALDDNTSPKLVATELGLNLL